MEISEKAIAEVRALRIHQEELYMKEKQEEKMLLREELSKNIKELEGGISALCVKFSKDTGFTITGIKVNSFPTWSGSGVNIDYGFNIKAEVSL